METQLLIIPLYTCDNKSWEIKLQTKSKFWNKNISDPILTAYEEPRIIYIYKMRLYSVLLMK